MCFEFHIHGQCTGDSKRTPDKCQCLIRYYGVRLGSQTTISHEGMFAIGCCFKCNRQGVSVCDIDNCDVSFTPSYFINMTMKACWPFAAASNEIG